MWNGAVQIFANGPEANSRDGSRMLKSRRPSGLPSQFKGIWNGITATSSCSRAPLHFPLVAAIGESKSEHHEAVRKASNTAHGRQRFAQCRWMLLNGPSKRDIASRINLGWTPYKPGLWTQPKGDWRRYTGGQPTHILDELSQGALDSEWARATNHCDGGASEHGVDMGYASNKRCSQRKRMHGKVRLSKPTPAGGTWPATRLKASHDPKGVPQKDWRWRTPCSADLGNAP